MRGECDDGGALLLHLEPLVAGANSESIVQVYVCVVLANSGINEAKHYTLRCVIAYKDTPLHIIPIMHIYDINKWVWMNAQNHYYCADQGFQEL